MPQTVCGTDCVFLLLSDLRLDELGMGPNEPKSFTRPTKNKPLSGIEVFR